MANPAHLLATLLGKWQEVPGQTAPEAARKDPSWVQHRLAIRHLLEIEQFLQGMQDAGQPAEVFLKALPNWTAAVMAFSTPWHSTERTIRRSIAVGDLALLQSLDVLMSTATYAAQIPASGLQPILESVESAAHLIRTSHALSDDSRRYLLGLIWEARAALEEIETFGEGHARRVLFELGGAMTSVALQVSDDPDEGPRWQERAADLLQQITLLGAKLAIAYGRVRLGLPPAE